MTTGYISTASLSVYTPLDVLTKSHVDISSGLHNFLTHNQDEHTQQTNKYYIKICHPIFEEKIKI